jgi:hypothetical protein
MMELPDKSKRLGNEHIPLQLFLPDPDNNVEVIRIANAPVGSYLLQVTATTLLRPPQDFAVAVAGPLSSTTLTPR